MTWPKHTYLPTIQPTLNLHRRTPPRSDARDLWHLGHWLQFWQLGTWIHDDRCYLTIKSDTGQHSQFLQCLEKWNHFCFIVNISSVTVLAYINVHFHETLPLKSIWSSLEAVFGCRGTVFSAILKAGIWVVDGMDQQSLMTTWKSTCTT